MELGRMLNLIFNEIMKILRQTSTYIMLGLLIGAVLTAGLIFYYNGQTIYANKDWKAQLIQQNKDLEKVLVKQKENAALEKILSQTPTSGVQIKDVIEKEIKMNNYRLEHDFPPIEGRTLWGFVTQTTGLISLVSLLSIIISAGIVAGEFTSGTIKFLLIRPLKRWKVLLAKYITVLIFAFGGLTILFSASFLVGGGIYGFSGATHPYLAYINGQVTELNMVSHVFTTYAYACLNMLMMVTFAFMISTVFRNNALAAGMSIFLMFTGNILVSFLNKHDWVKYILFANTDLTQYVTGTPLVEGMTMNFSLMVLAVYFVIFIAASWIFFSKRDIE